MNNNDYLNYSYIVFSSVHFFGLLPDACRDHLGVHVLDLGDPLDHEGRDVIERLVSVDGVSNEDNILDFGQLRKLADLVPRLHSVVGNEEGVQLDAWVQSLQLLDLVVRNP